MTQIQISIFILFFLLLLDLASAVTRASLLNARPYRLMTTRESSPGQITRTLELIEHPRLRASLRLAQTLARIFAAVLLFFILQSARGEVQWLEIAQWFILFAAAIILIIIDLIFESFVLRDPEKWALRMEKFGRFLVLIFTPLLALPVQLVKQPNGGQPPGPVIEDEIKTWAESEEEPGSLERGERRMIYSIFQFGDTLTREIMVPRIDMLALDVKTSLSTATKALIESGYSRVPVYESTVDEIIGLLYAKDILRVLDRPADSVSLRELLRPAYFVPETKKADDLLAEMQSHRIHLAVVVDEYGGVAGIVTLEDIVEEIIGEIRDEYDQGEDMLYQPAGPDEYVFLGGIDLDDFNQLMNSHLPKVEADTLAGFLYEKMGSVPLGGESIRVDDLMLTVEQVIGRRIRRVRVRRAPALEGELKDDTSD